MDILSASPNLAFFTQFLQERRQETRGRVVIMGLSLHSPIKSPPTGGTKFASGLELYLSACPHQWIPWMRVLRHHTFIFLTITNPWPLLGGTWDRTS
jgi:hypothetical protein